MGSWPAAVPWIERWLRSRRQAGIGRTPPLFCQITAGRAGKRMSRHAVGSMLKRRAARAGLELERIHAHALRHSLAVRMASKLPMWAVQLQVGHASFATTGQYLAHLSADDLAEGLADVCPAAMNETGRDWCWAWRDEREQGWRWIYGDAVKCGRALGSVKQRRGTKD